MFWFLSRAQLQVIVPLWSASTPRVHDMSFLTFSVRCSKIADIFCASVNSGLAVMVEEKPMGQQKSPGDFRVHEGFT